MILALPATGGEKGTKINLRGAYCAFFDGHCSKNLGAGGYVVYHPEGHLVAAKAIYYGGESRTCNEAELDALAGCFEALLQLGL